MDRSRTPHHPARRPQKILVIGAGVAGLSAAFRLQRAGYDVTVLERSAHVGGRMWTEEIDGYRVDTGAAMLPDSYHQMRRLIRDAGLAHEVGPSGDVYGFLRDGEVHRFGKRLPRDLLTTRLLSARSKTRLLRLAADTRRMGDRITFRDLTRAPEADESCVAYADRRLNQELFDYLIEPLSTNYYFAPPEELSMTHVYLAARSALGIGYFNSPQGMAFLPRGLARQLDVRHHTTVSAVEETKDAVTVGFTDHDGVERQETAAACVIAVPGPLVARIWPGLPAPMRAFLSRLRYSTCLHVSFGLSARPRESSMWIFVPRREYPGGLGVCLDHNRAPGRAPDGKGLITVYWPTYTSEALYDLPDEDVTARALHDIEQVDLFPGLARRIEMTSVSRCRPCVPATHPGSIAELTAGVRSLDRGSRVALAGDYFSFGSTNAALTSGEIAASRLAVTLDARRPPL
ncbi:protoporphyrinogen/coproporphyrinogen oxidase [Streptomyces alkaliterrae]|uniref:FAD-dependent oxidoreductase n=1 Tax=Streptomyces alkaliterrae TaxID=2213162 RepID=A0A5P0YT58_9ACTN|nr:FAD-dependent oxidoreductase [Streptomyces alkaliterrae]MBB1255514.1 FAD-dependent oxidoreductase [Streptomyces alkaliterrae]MBB1260650.1 FAD-dependent oxidoreductase [Streptomyces alkaliterrae]MQS03503.1 FAD-dependent oxidoreductase [Streptomyces alkaliterrae]